MDAEQFSLSWNNFHSHLSSGFQSLLQSEDLVDVTLAVDGRYIKAHKTVLSICSPYFTDLFRANPCKHPIVIMQGTTYNILHSLLQFIYKGEVSVTQEEIPMFMKLAETLKIKGLTEKEEATPSNGLPLQDAPTIDTKHTLDSDRHVMKRNKLPKPKPYTKPVDTVTIPQHVTDTRIEQDFPLIAKIEPVDVPDEEDYRYNTDSYDDEQHPVDISHMSETSMTLGEPSEPDNYFKSSQDISSSGGAVLPSLTSSSPSSTTTSIASSSLSATTSPASSSPLLFLKSRRGHPVLIHAGHMYTLPAHVTLSTSTSTMSQSSSSGVTTAAVTPVVASPARSTWLCVKQRTLRCGGCLVTTRLTSDVNAMPMLLSYSGHNHAQLHDVIQRLQAASCSPSPELP